jgi:hypothetical protein
MGVGRLTDPSGMLQQGVLESLQENGVVAPRVALLRYSQDLPWLWPVILAQAGLRQAIEGAALRQRDTQMNIEHVSYPVKEPPRVFCKHN